MPLGRSVFPALLSLTALSSACATAPRADPPVCTISAEDQAWIDQSTAAWRYAAEHISLLEQPETMRAVFFDDDCMLTSDTAMRGGAPNWTATLHGGTIRMPDGGEAPAGVMSFASSENGVGYFTMATPSVWRAANVPGRSMGLELLMTAVLLHEGSHVAQVPTYGQRIGALAEREGLPESFSDDSIQHEFGADAEFTAAVAHETDLLYRAAAASDDAEARRLAREARDAMRARYARWFVGERAYLEEAEDIWLTFEGAAQWVGYQWLISPEGANRPEAAVMADFRGNRWWSQTEGHALFMALDRLNPGAWRAHAFGDGALTALEMLDQAIARGA